MVVVQEVRCTNCDEPVLVSYVLVRRPSADKAPHECPVCDDMEAVASVLADARESHPDRRPLLLSVRHEALAPLKRPVDRKT